MLKNHLKIALRTLRRHKGYAFINIVGLAVGMACCLLIVRYVQDERSFDRFHEQADRIYRLVEDRGTRDARDQGSVRHLASTSYEVGPLLHDGYPEAITHAVRFYRQTALIVRDEARTFQEDRLFFADSAVFDAFSFRLLRGDPATALDAPYTLVLTASTARKYFGDEDPIGQVLRYEGRQDFEVTGVVEDVPANAHFHFDLLASYASLKTFMPWTQSHWQWPPIHTYLKLAAGVEAATVQAQLPGFILQYGGEEQAAERSFALQPLTDIHLHSQREDELAPNGDIASVYLFSAIALFILLLACINFMNLTTARGASRAWEASMRKVMGAGRLQLVRQFLSEAMLQALLALVLALVLVEWLLPVFNVLSGKALTFQLFSGWLIPAALIGLVLGIGVLAGSYPALYFSGFQPVAMLKGMSGRDGSATLRKALVVFQFAVSCALIIGTGVVYSQLQYLQHKKLGFDKEHVVAIDLIDYPDRINYERLKQALLQHPGVVSVAASSTIPGRETPSNYPIVPEGTRPEDGTRIPTLAVDHDFIATFNLALAAGRSFSKAFPTDTSEALLLNETAAERLAWTDPVGKKITLSYDHPTRGFVQKEGTVVGIVKDFHQASLHRAIDPLLLHVLPPSQFFYYLSVRIRPEDVPATLAFLETQWKAYSTSGYPFSYTFMDAAFDALYRAEARFGDVVAYFSGLAILIACLGLFGLAAFTTERRTKEIGVRKTLGASIPSIVALLSKDFLKLVLIAFVLAAPLAYFAMTHWLHAFAYRIEISWPIFLCAGLVALLVALLTVSYQAIRTALTDPVKALRYE